MENTCIGCNENEVTITELYCLNCYLAKYEEALLVSEEIEQLFATAEAK